MLYWVLWPYKTKVTSLNLSRRWYPAVSAGWSGDFDHIGTCCWDSLLCIASINWSDHLSDSFWTQKRRPARRNLYAQWRFYWMFNKNVCSNSKPIVPTAPFVNIFFVKNLFQNLKLFSNSGICFIETRPCKKKKQPCCGRIWSIGW